MKAERIQQLKKAFTLYRRRGYGFAYRWKLYFNLKFQEQEVLEDFKKKGLHKDKKRT